MASIELRLVLAILATLLLLDLTLRAIDTRLSGNLAHVSQIPVRLQRVGNSGDALLILGNSLTNNGMSAETLASAMGKRQVAKITPDATALWDWQCVLDHQVLGRSDRRFDTLIIGTAWQLLSDRTRPDPSRLGSLYCTFSDLRNPGDIGLHTMGDVGEFVLARSSRMYALRDTLRNRLLDMFIPSYQQFTAETNAAAGAGGTAGAPAAAALPAVSYDRFEKLVGRARSAGIRVVVVAMPVRQPYVLDAHLQYLAGSGQISLLDMRNAPGIDPGDFLDGIHLNAEGRATLSELIARELRSSNGAR